MVDIYGKWADVRRAAAQGRRPVSGFGDGQELGAELRRLGIQSVDDKMPHGMRLQELAEMRRNMAAFEPAIAGGVAGDLAARLNLLKDVLPKGATLYPKTAQTLNTDGGAATTLFHNMIPYQPELDQTRQMMPTARTQWNRYARLFYKTDAVIPTVIDMLGELSFSDFTLSGDGVEGDVKKDMEASLDECQIQRILPDIVKEFYMLGEAGVHNYFDESKGYWTYTTIHNPDQLDVIQTPFVPMEPVVEFCPDTTLRGILTSSHPMLRELRESLPSEMVSAVISGRNITLAPTNFTFLARKLHPYDMRGTSILSRLWRILCFEDALFGAAIATARRRAAPLKAAFIGNDTFMPPPEYGDKVLRLITQSELDPMSWVVLLNCVRFELVGVQEMVMSINAHYDLIERVKLSALGVSRSLINGETNYSAAAAGLTIFMQRLQSIRTMVVRQWLMPKFFGVLAEAREWIKPTSAEVAHNVRVKRSHQELLDRNAYITPDIEWSKSLDSKVDADRANILQQLETAGVLKFSSRTKFAAVGIDRDTEWQQIKQESAEAKKIAGDDPDVLARLGYGPSAPIEGAEGAGALAGPTTLPPLPEGSLGEFGPPPNAPVEPAAGVGVSATEDAEASDLAAAGWEASAVAAGKRLLQTFDPADAADTAPWDRVLDSPAVRAALSTGDPGHLWNAVEAWMIERAYPADVILSLEKALTSRSPTLASVIARELIKLESEMGDGDASI